MSLTLVVMAAGLGSRFGGTKQLAVVGDGGEAFLDFAIADALAAGMEKVVLIVRSDIEDDLRRHVSAQHPELDVAYVLQDTHGPSRNKPWGTAHAVLTAAPEVPDRFCVVNADDYYGRSTFAALAAAATDLPDDRALLAGFRLGQTLPEIGEVSRGICGVDGTELVSLVETHGISRGDDGVITSSDPAGVLTDDAVASMNCWVFAPSLFGHLATEFDRFIVEHGHEETSEFLLPTVVDSLRTAGTYTVGIVPTDEPWVGVTNPDDLEIARRRIATVRT